ncbi:MAG: SDR family oxidoreductase, partial [Rhodospirillales bacterium]|nr:SDR family oxidoreductase [Rhodospirillales bacterium]
GNGWKVSGSVRESSQIPKLREEGMNAFVFDSQEGDQGISELPLSDATHVLSTVPPGLDGDPISDLVKTCRHISWIGYLSTTGVYGNTDGKVVDETSPINPSSPRSKRRADAESKWRALFAQDALPVHTFRLPGIYGPGRSVFESYQDNRLRRVEKPGHVFNRIHVDDIVQALEASMNKPNPGAVYNVCDDLPIEPSEVATYAYELMEIKPPAHIPFEELVKTMSPMALTFWQDNRCVSNERMKSELGITLRYPDYKSGLKAIFKLLR